MRRVPRVVAIVTILSVISLTIGGSSLGLFRYELQYSEETRLHYNISEVVFFNKEQSLGETITNASGYVKSNPFRKSDSKCKDDDDQLGDDDDSSDDDDTGALDHGDVGRTGYTIDVYDAENFYVDDVSSVSSEDESKDSPTIRGRPIQVQHDRRKQSSPIQLAHVWFPYDSLDPFFPRDQSQNVTWGSLWRAKQYFERENPDKNFTIYCAILWTDVNTLQKQEPPLCQPHNILILNRSSHTEYPHIQPPIHYPFIQDILLSAGDAMDRYSARRKNKRYEKNQYLIYTNPDIGVVEIFYTALEKAILHTPRTHEAFQINHRTIGSEYLPAGKRNR